MSTQPAPSWGAIDLDPASNPEAQQIVQAASYHTKRDDGLAQEWGRVWLNPPYSRGLIDRFIEKLLAEIDAGHCTEAIVLVNAGTSSGWFQHMLRYAPAVCFNRDRIRFIGAGGQPAGDRPAIGQAILYFGRAADRFADVFGSMGAVVAGNTSVGPRNAPHGVEAPGEALGCGHAAGTVL